MAKKHHRKQKRKAQRGKKAKSRPTWRDIVFAVFVRSKTGELLLSDVYAALERHPRTRTNPTWKATIRRTVQQDDRLRPAGPFGAWKLK